MPFTAAAPITDTDREMNGVWFFNTPGDWSDQSDVQGEGERGVHAGAHVLTTRSHFDVDGIYRVWEPNGGTRCE